MSAIPSSSFVSHRRHPSRLPFGSLRSALTGPGADANGPFLGRREWQTGHWPTSPGLLLASVEQEQCR